MFRTATHACWLRHAEILRSAPKARPLWWGNVNSRKAGKGLVLAQFLCALSHPMSECLFFFFFSEHETKLKKLWCNLCVGLKKLEATGERVRQTLIFLGLLFINTLFMASGKAQNHCTNYRNKRAFPQIPKTQTPLGYAEPTATSS